MSELENTKKTVKNSSTEIILMALCGMSSGVVTETVWALAKANPSTVVDQVIVLTTQRGAECLRRELFENGVWEELRASLKIKNDKLRFGDTPNSIRVMTTRDEARCLDDINTVEASAAAGDFILANIRQITENPDQRLIFSMAGGRKTMSALSALCMTLLARPEDRLCHVLVQPPYDSPRLDPKFYFPKSGQTHQNGEESVKSEDGEILLHDIPFVRYRSLFPQQYGRAPGSYSNLVGLANENLDQLAIPPTIRLNPPKKQCVVGDLELSLPRREYLMFWFLCQRRVAGQQKLGGQQMLADAFMDMLSGLTNEDYPYITDEDDSSLEEGRIAGKLCNNLRQKLREALSENDFRYCDPSAEKGRYGIEAPAGNISIEMEQG